MSGAAGAEATLAAGRMGCDGLVDPDESGTELAARETRQQLVSVFG
jgi:hypothetical protein